MPGCQLLRYKCLSFMSLPALLWGVIRRSLIELLLVLHSGIESERLNFVGRCGDAIEILLVLVY